MEINRFEDVLGVVADRRLGTSIADRCQQTPEAVAIDDHIGIDEHQHATAEIAGSPVAGTCRAAAAAGADDSGRQPGQVLAKIRISAVVDDDDLMIDSLGRSCDGHDAVANGRPGAIRGYDDPDVARHCLSSQEIKEREGKR